MKSCVYHHTYPEKSKICLDKGPEGYKVIFAGKNGEILADRKITITREPMNSDSENRKYSYTFYFDDSCDALNPDESYAEDADTYLTDSNGAIELGHLEDVSKIHFSCRDKDVDCRYEILVPQT